MATPRKRYFKVADSILREPMPRDAKLTLLMLMAWLNQRWARDGIPDEDAGNALLTRGALVEVSGRSQFKSGANALRTLTKFVSMSVEVQGEFVSVSWPKFAEFQYSQSRSEGDGGPGTSPRRAPSDTRHATRDTRREPDAPAARARGPLAVVGTPPIEVHPLPDWRPLLNALGTCEGEVDEKSAFLEDEFPKIHAEAMAASNPKRVVPLAIAYYRNYLKGPRPFKNFAAKQETRRKLAEHEAECAAAMREIEEAEGYEAAHR